MTTEQDRILYTLLLEIEVEALRSVLSEYEGDKMEYTQMIKANAAYDLRKSIVRRVED